MIKLKANPMRSTVSTDDLQPEEDKNEIEYNAGELKVIQRMKRMQTSNSMAGAQLNTAVEQEKPKTKCCALLKRSRNKDEDSPASRVRPGQIKQANAQT